METLRRSRIPTTAVTANGGEPTNEEAQVYVHDLDLFVTVQLLEDTLAVSWKALRRTRIHLYVHDLDLFVTVQILEDTPTVLSLGKLCEQHGCTSEWTSGEKPRLTKQGKKRCKTENFVPLVVPGLSSNYGTSSSSTSPPQDSSSTSSSPASERSDKPAPGNWRDSPKTQDKMCKKGHQSSLGRPVARSSRMVGGVHRWSRRCRSACTCTHFPWLRFGTSYKSGTQAAQYSYSLPKRPKLRSMLANQDGKGSLQKTHWRSSTSSKKVWWLDDSRSRSPQRGR